MPTMIYKNISIPGNNETMMLITNKTLFRGMLGYYSMSKSVSDWLYLALNFNFIAISGYFENFTIYKLIIREEYNNE